MFANFNSLKSLMTFLMLFLILNTGCKKPSTTRSPADRSQQSKKPINAPDYNPGQQQYPPIVHNGFTLTPVALDLKGIRGYIQQQPNWLPKGAYIDTSSEKLYWLPTIEQQGSYSGLIPLYGIQRKIFLNIEHKNFRQGPPSNFRDGDVGYILVHGKGIDYCADPEGLEDYWRQSKNALSPDQSYLKVVCYDGTKRVADTALSVAQQIQKANCGRFNKCIVVTHSMGGLMLEHMMIYSRSPRENEKYPEYFNNREEYLKAKEKILFVVSIASAAGGSKAAELLLRSSEQSTIQELIGKISAKFEDKNDAARNLLVDIATTEVAPINEDPGVIFFMVPGFSKELAKQVGDILGTSDENPFDVFNGDNEIAALDRVVHYSSRSDGLVSFRSACGIADSDVDAGPGWKASLEEQFQYCLNSQKKPSHFVWFLTNLNHSKNRWAEKACKAGGNECEIYFPNYNQRTFIRETRLNGRSATMAIRYLLTKDALP
ncbi:MAG: hypothetical protein R3B45_17595 [Bdellovibrionota bacterium]